MKLWRIFKMRRQFGGTQKVVRTIYINNDGQNYLKNKVDNIVKWYEEFTGLDEVRTMQNRVIDAQNRLVHAQERRREAAKALEFVQNKLKDIHAELDTTSRGEERYLHLVTQEHSVLKEERNLKIEFQSCEKEERDCFAFLSSSVKESHEKERAQAERTKYWSVIGSVIGTVIGVLGSTISNELKMKRLRNLVTTSVEDHSEKFFRQHEMELQSLVNEVKSFSAVQAVNYNEKSENMGVRHMYDTKEQEVIMMELIQQQNQEIRKALIITSLICVIAPILCSIIQR